jgi:predicted transcriptional regulator of viral defense system
LAIDRRAASRRLGNLARAGWLSRIRRAVYAVRPLDAMPGVGLAEEDAWALGARLFAPCYVGGWTAAGHWGLTEQLFRSTFIVTAKHVRKSDTIVGRSAFRLGHGEVPGRLKTVWRSGAPVKVSSVERTIVDACGNPAWVGGGRHLAEIFRAAVADGKLSAPHLLAELRHVATGAALGRAGLLTERYWPGAVSVIKYAVANRGAGYVRFDPAVNGRGRLKRRWGLWVNVSLPEAGM